MLELESYGDVQQKVYPGYEVLRYAISFSLQISYVKAYNKVNKQIYQSCLRMAHCLSCLYLL
jgi:hypothetical protein